MKLPFISAICPTYKRDKLLANAVQCFVDQDYPLDRRELIILDDAGQFDSQVSGNGWSVISTTERYPSLPAKFNALANYCSGDVLVVWEDDDLYLNHHLDQIAQCYLNSPFEYYVPERVYSTYGKPFGEYQTEMAAGRFHASWAFTRKLFESVGGYPDTGRLDFDQQMRDILTNATGGRGFYDTQNCSYVYRWGNGQWHGSQAGEDGFKALWDRIGAMPFEHKGLLEPKYDKQTELIFQNIALSV